ncbi:hypothetical protein DFH01_08575 [Falsiroseomonas bella]|uniref:Uncharacterized protein n=1 Tax=Falsiroseomonas bella TaxID=2184016 RepID=A0A317FCV1_9PROT|nr:hypothetical protein [Falsiroseomonas bella]PWS36934.1 hypothetical protein DFH01_08575 [Falsiroseomonas bella]
MPFAIRRSREAPKTFRPRGAVPAIGLVLLLGACARPEVGFVESAWSPFTGGRNVVTVDSVTVQRVRGETVEFTPLQAEPGNVWPEQEAPRPTLMSGPEEAFRNIPDYRPQLIEPVPPARSPVPTPNARGTSGSVTPLPPPREASRIPAASPPTAAAPPPPPSAVGRATIDPAGRPATVTNEAGRLQSTTQPGVGTSAVVRDGNVETWIGPDGQARTRVVPR